MGVVSDIIEEYKNNEVLWNRHHELWRMPTVKSSLISKIALRLGIGRTELEKTWEYLENKFKREEKKVINSKRSGNGLNDNYRSSWPLYDSLTFLRKTTTPRTSTGNLSCLFVEKKKQKENPRVEEKKKSIAPQYIQKNGTKQSYLEPTMDSCIDKDLRKTIQSELAERSGDDKYEHFLKCLLPFVEDIKSEKLLEYRIKFTELTDKFEKKNDDDCRIIEVSEVELSQRKRTPKRKLTPIKIEDIKQESDVAKTERKGPLDLMYVNPHNAAMLNVSSQMNPSIMGTCNLYGQQMHAAQPVVYTGVQNFGYSNFPLNMHTVPAAKTQIMDVKVEDFALRELMETYMKNLSQSVPAAKTQNMDVKVEDFALREFMETYMKNLSRSGNDSTEQHDKEKVADARGNSNSTGTEAEKKI